MSGPSQRVIINADDLGFAPGVNRGILDVYEAGVLSSASMMVNTPAFLEAAALVRDRAPRLGVGLHFNLLTGSPMSDVPTLADPRTGAFYSLTNLARRAFSGRVAVEDVRRECDAQLGVLKSAGIVPTHIDSHRHTHALPGILQPVLASAVAAGVRTVRRPLDRVVMSDAIASAKMIALSASWRAATGSLSVSERALIERSPNFRGIALQGAPDVQTRLLALLDHLPGGTTEIMLHPGYVDEVLAAQDPYQFEREREIVALKSTAVVARLGRGDIQLVTF